MCSSVDLPAPDGATSATDSPGKIARSAPFRTVSVPSPSPVVAFDHVQEQDRASLLLLPRHLARASTMVSFVAQRLDRIEARRAPGRIERRQEGQHQRHHDDRDGLARVHLGRQLRRK